MASYFTKLPTRQGNRGPAFSVSLRKKVQTKAIISSYTLLQLSRPHENSFECARTQRILDIHSIPVHLEQG